MSLTEANLEKKLQSATNSQDSIQTLSLWLLHHRAHHQKIVSTWMKVLKKAKISHRLTLFYLANDVIQNSKRKGISLFKESFAEVLREATLLVREEPIRQSVNRVFNIWSERNVYDSDFIADLQGILANAKVPVTAPSKLLAEFKCEKVIEKLRNVSKLEVETTAKMATVNVSKLNATNAEIVQKLKDRTHGQQFSSEFDESARCLEELVKSLNKEVQERNELIFLLEQSEIYYDTQRGEAKIVANAYKNFGSRVKALQKKLEELIETFPAPSPLPSPCPDAPSPTTSDLEDELELPVEAATYESEKVEKSTADVSKKSDTIRQITTSANSVGKPIPILSSFLNQDGGKMSSWLDAFPKKGGPASSVTETKSSDSGSLDSRLSSLLQKIPNLPGSLQNTLLNPVSVSESTTNSPCQSIPKNGNVSSFSSLDTTTIKDDYSGQNTPLQDEDTPTASGPSSFFSRLAAAPKASQSPKDILKGLTSLIQTASSTKEKSFNIQDKPLSWHSTKDESLDKPCSFFSKIVSNQSSHTSLSPPPFFNSPALSTDTGKKDNSRNLVVTVPQTTASNSPSPSSFSQSATTSSIHENLSFIPTLVPSTPTGSHFKFEAENDFEEYDPSAQSFDMDVEIDSGADESNHTPSSEGHSESSPEKETQEEMIETISTSRQSTLITLITDSAVPSEPDLKKKEETPNTGQSYSSNLAVSHNEEWPLNIPTTTQADRPKETINKCSPAPVVDPFFVSSPPLLTEKDGYSNGQGRNFSGDWPHSKIETVQSLRTTNDNKWFGNDWMRFDTDYRHGFSGRARNNQRFQEYSGYQHKNNQPHFQSQNMWDHQEHQYGGYNQRYPHKRFAPFASRGRGWKRHPRPY